MPAPLPSQIIVLGSSSPLPDLHGPSTWELPVHFSSSPPALLHFPRKVSAPRGGSRAEQIPSGAATGFRSARDVVAELGLGPGLGLQGDAGECGEDAVVGETEGKTTAKRGRKRKSDEVCAKPDGQESGQDTRTKETGKLKRPKQRSAEEAGTDRQSRRVEELHDSPATVQSKRLQLEDDVCKGGVTVNQVVADSQESESASEHEVCVFETAPSLATSASTTMSNAGKTNVEVNVVNAIEEKVLEKASTFADLVGAFGYNGQAAPAKESNDNETQKAGDSAGGPIRVPIAKKSDRALASVPTAAPVFAPTSVTIPTPVAKPQKKPPKSSRTVTNIVLEQYRSPKKPTEPAADAIVPYDAKLLQPLQLTAEGGVAKKKRATKSKSKKKPPPQPVKLLSPSQLQRRLQRQDMLFGTSSQLATEESPKTIRALQQAYRESEASVIDLTTPLSRRSVGVASPAKGLWSAATRGDEDYVFEPTQRQPSNQSQELLSEDEFADIDMIQDAQQLDNVVKVAEEQSLRLRLSSTLKKTGPRMRIADSPSFIMPPSPVAARSASFSTSVAHSDKGAPSDKTKTVLPLESVPLAEVTPMKKPRGRPRKIANTIAPVAVEGQEPPAKKRRGRPPKDPNAPPKPRKATAKKQQAKISPVDEFMPIEDAIIDPEPPLTPSPPRRRASPTKPTPLDLSPLSAAAVVAAASREPVEKVRKPATKKEDRPTNVAKMEILFPRITQAVTTAPRGTQQHPSWWEKMLLYDPIVLEDFMAWLNDVGLREYGGMGVSIESEANQHATAAVEAHAANRDDDGEARGGKGKAKIKAKGKAIAKSDEQATENPKIIIDDEIWMVQKWCETNSVCCLFREGLRGGVRLVY